MVGVAAFVGVASDRSRGASPGTGSLGWVRFLGLVRDGFPQMDGTDGAADPGGHQEDDVGYPLREGA
jgi:hypothetical protein